MLSPVNDSNLKIHEKKSLSVSIFRHVRLESIKPKIASMGINSLKVYLNNLTVEYF